MSIVTIIKVMITVLILHWVILICQIAGVPNPDFNPECVHIRLNATLAGQFVLKIPFLPNAYECTMHCVNFTGCTDISYNMSSGSCVLFRVTNITNLPKFDPHSVTIDLNIRPKEFVVSESSIPATNKTTTTALIESSPKSSRQLSTFPSYSDILGWENVSPEYLEIVDGSKSKTSTSSSPEIAAVLAYNKNTTNTAATNYQSGLNIRENRTKHILPQTLANIDDNYEPKTTPKTTALALIKEHANRTLKGKRRESQDNTYNSTVFPPVDISHVSTLTSPLILPQNTARNHSFSTYAAKTTIKNPVGRLFISDQKDATLNALLQLQSTRTIFSTFWKASNNLSRENTDVNDLELDKAGPKSTFKASELNKRKQTTPITPQNYNEENKTNVALISFYLNSNSQNKTPTSNHSGNYISPPILQNSTHSQREVQKEIFTTIRKEFIQTNRFSQSSTSLFTTDRKSGIKHIFLEQQSIILTVPTPDGTRISSGLETVYGTDFSPDWTSPKSKFEVSSPIKRLQSASIKFSTLRGTNATVKELTPSNLLTNYSNPISQNPNSLSNHFNKQSSTLILRNVTHTHQIVAEGITTTVSSANFRTYRFSLSSPAIKSPKVTVSRYDMTASDSKAHMDLSNRYQNLMFASSTDISLKTNLITERNWRKGTTTSTYNTKQHSIHFPAPTIIKITDQTSHHMPLNTKKTTDHNSHRHSIKQAYTSSDSSISHQDTSGLNPFPVSRNVTKVNNFSKPLFTSDYQRAATSSMFLEQHSTNLYSSTHEGIGNHSEITNASRKYSSGNGRIPQSRLVISESIVTSQSTLSFKAQTLPTDSGTTSYANTKSLNFVSIQDHPDKYISPRMLGNSPHSQTGEHKEIATTISQQLIMTKRLSPSSTAITTLKLMNWSKNETTMNDTESSMNLSSHNQKSFSSSSFNLFTNMDSITKLMTSKDNSTSTNTIKTFEITSETTRVLLLSPSIKSLIHELEFDYENSSKHIPQTINPSKTNQTTTISNNRISNISDEEISTKVVITVRPTLSNSATNLTTHDEPQKKIQTINTKSIAIKRTLVETRFNPFENPILSTSKTDYDSESNDINETLLNSTSTTSKLSLIHSPTPKMVKNRESSNPTRSSTRNNHAHDDTTLLREASNTVISSTNPKGFHELETSEPQNDHTTVAESTALDIHHNSGKNCGDFEFKVPPSVINSNIEVRVKWEENENHCFFLMHMQEPGVTWLNGNTICQHNAPDDYSGRLGELDRTKFREMMDAENYEEKVVAWFGRIQFDPGTQSDKKWIEEFDETVESMSEDIKGQCGQHNWYQSRNCENWCAKPEYVDCTGSLQEILCQYYI